ncbi:MAG: TonB-dependent receptor [Ferruginibacter sp.]
MKKKIFIAAAVIFSSAARAQTDSTKLLEDVVISATKYPLKSSQTAKLLTIITKEELAKAGGKDLAQVLMEMGGLFVNGANSSMGKDKAIYLRGASVDHTLITIDGVPVYDPSGIGGIFDIRNFNLENIERIEILKGSQSTLYGTDAIAGVINIITKKAGQKLLNMNGTLGAGSFNTYKANAGISGRKDKLDYSASYGYAKSGGINEAVTQGSVYDKDGFKQQTFNANLGVHATKNIRVAPYMRYSKINGDIDQGAFTDELDYTYTQKNLQAGVRNEFVFGKAKLNLLYNFNKTERLYIDDSVKSRNGFDIYSRGNYSGKEHFVDAYADFSIRKWIRLTAGADFRTVSTAQLYISIPAWAPPLPLDTSMTQQSIYTAVNLKKDDFYNFEAGGRINFHSAYGNHLVFNLNQSYTLNERIKISSNISSGYRTPSLYQLYSEYGNRDLKPEASTSVEIGLQYFSADKKMNARIVYFGRNVKDVLFFYTDPFSFKSAYINQDRQNDRGLELDAGYTGFKNTSIKLFYNYVNGKIHTKNFSGKDTTFFNLLRRPKHNAVITVSTLIKKRFNIGTSLSFVGQRKDRYFDAVSFQSVDTVLKRYILLGLYADYGFLKNRLIAFADIRNITDVKYTEVAGFNTPGFNANAGIRFSF